MDITGKIKVKGVMQNVSDKFCKLDFVITTNEQYPQHISMQLTQQRCALIDPYKVGDEIKVHINLRGREWTSPQGEVKHFNTIEAWKIEGVSWSEEVKKDAAGTNAVPISTPPTDDLPF